MEWRRGWGRGLVSCWIRNDLGVRSADRTGSGG